MNTPLLTFNAKSVSCDILEKTLVARKETVDRIYNNLRDRILTGSNYQSLVVAPRGSGKTHMTKVLYCRISKDEELRPKVLIAYMIEDEAGVGSFMHLILHILDALHRYKEPGTENIPAIKEEISKMAFYQQEQAFVDALLLILGGRKLVLLIENFDAILSQMGKEDARLRDFMHNHDHISILATAQLLSSQLNKAEYPFYQFFDTRNLQRLTFEEMVELVEALVEIEEDAEIKKNMNEALADPKQDLKAKLRAIYDLTMGNHRLTVHFYSFLKADLKADLSTVFIKQMNSLKSYYEQFIKQLSTQQQRIVQVLSISRVPITPKEISQKSFLPQNSVTKQLGELAKMGYVDAHKEGRNTLYEIDEPLMRICFEINENPDGIAALFIDFLKVVYDRKFLTRQYLMFQYGSKFNPKMQKKYAREASMYRLAIDKLYLDNEAYDKLENVVSEPDMKKLLDVTVDKEELVKNILESSTKNPNDLFNLLESNFEIVKIDAELLMLMGSLYRDKNQYQKANEAFEKSLKIDPNDYLPYFGISFIMSDEGKYEEAIFYLKKTIKFNPSFVEAFFQLGLLYEKMNEKIKACSEYENVLRLAPDHENALIKLGKLAVDSYDYRKALNYLERAYLLRPNDYEIINELGYVQLYLDNIDSAKELFHKSIKIKPTFDKAIANLSVVYIFLKDYKKSIEYIQKAISIKPQIAMSYLIYMESLIRTNNSKKAYELFLDTKSKIDFSSITNLGGLIAVANIDYPENDNHFTFKIMEELAALKIRDIDNIWAVSILRGLMKIDKSKKQDFIKFHKSFIHYFLNSKILPLTLKYMDVGVRYLIMNEKMAIYDLSKEERNVFFQYIEKIKTSNFAR